ncbi:ROK family protein [Patescibacteria group bacterium]|nr:ROK family protein [Patescibacteria group bacterium]
MSILALDIGGTNMRLALGEGDALSHIESQSTPKNPQEAVSAISAYIQKHDAQIESVVGGVAGAINNGVVHRSPNLPGWKGLSFGDLLSEALTVPAALYNDADLGGLGEAVYGAGKDYVLVGYMAIGTGVGGTLVHNKRIISSLEGLEPGKQILEHASGRTLEDFVSGAGIKRETGKESAEAGRVFYGERTKILAAGIYNSVRHWSPEIFVLAGSLMNEETAFRIADVNDALANIARDVPMPRIVHGTLDDTAGLYGALATLKT